MTILAHSSAEGGASIPGGDGEWTEGQFEALVTLHMLKPGQVLDADDCWAIEYTRLQADAVENNAVDAFDEGRKHGILSVVGKTEAALLEEVERLRTKLSVQKALTRHYSALYATARSAAESAYRFISQPLRMDTPAGGRPTATYGAEGYNALAAKLRAVVHKPTTASSVGTEPSIGGVNP